MTSQTPSHTGQATSTQRKRTYLACKACRKRKVKCVTKGEDTPCKRCSERGFECEYLPVCVENEGELLGHSDGQGSKATSAYSSTQGKTPASQGFHGAATIQSGAMPYPQHSSFNFGPSRPQAGILSYQHQHPTPHSHGPPSAAYPQTRPAYAPHHHQPPPGMVPSQSNSQYDQYFSHFGLPPMYPTR
ncbi:hypothetical protein C8R43DRAFT_940344 [Mycena crocata]|nr:hypothetical protein C8R43DRAFT_940344 [Mycena crocata]